MLTRRARAVALIQRAGVRVGATGGTVRFLRVGRTVDAVAWTVLGQVALARGGATDGTRRGKAVRRAAVRQPVAGLRRVAWAGGRPAYSARWTLRVVRTESTRAVTELGRVADAGRGTALVAEEEGVGRTLGTGTATDLGVVAWARRRTTDERPPLAPEEHVVRTYLGPVTGLGLVAWSGGTATDGAYGIDDVVRTGAAATRTDFLRVAGTRRGAADGAGRDQVTVGVAA